MPVFQSFLQGGFECATHKNIHNQRVDVVRTSRHDEFVLADYLRLKSVGMTTVREGARWHVIEPAPGVYELSSLDILYDAAEETGIEIILDLMHFGWPDFIDPFGTEFVGAFERFTAEIAAYLRARRMTRIFVLPINEISFLAWAGGDQGAINPHARGRGAELKQQMVKAAIAASNVLLCELPQVCLVSAEPAIHILGRHDVPGDCLQAERHRLAMFEAWDMLTGRTCPELGGNPRFIDVVGVNYYDRNQWVNHGEPVFRGDSRYRPFHSILSEIWERYRLPLMVSETGTEDGDRPEWFEYIGQEVRIAQAKGIPVEGICLYPILNHRGWDDDRHCHNGLYDYADDSGRREIYQPLADAIDRQARAFAASQPNLALTA